MSDQFISGETSMMPDFRNKTVCVFLSGKPSSQGKYVVDPHFELQAGRLFLVGNTPSASRIGNCPIAVAWDRIDAYVLGDSIRDFVTNEEGEARK